MTRQPSLKTEIPSVTGLLVPAEELFSRLRQVSEKMLTGWSEIVSREVGFLQQAMLDECVELQDLSRVRNPQEFVQSQAKFFFAQAERSGKALQELGQEIGRIWFAELEALAKTKGGGK